MATRLRAGAPLVLWMGVFLPPLLVLADLQAGYSLASRACRDGRGLELLVSSAIAAALAVAIGWAAWRVGMRRTHEQPHASESLRRGQGFLAVGSAVLTAAALLVIAGMALVRVLQPCG